MRERREDIPLLVDHFVDKYAVSLAVPPPQIPAQTLTLLTHYEWPGNVRELQNCIYSAMTVCEGSSIEPDALPERIRKGIAGAARESATAGPSPLAQVVTHATEQAEKEAIQEAIAKTNGNREKAAELLGIGRTTLYRKLKQYGLE